MAFRDRGLGVVHLPVDDAGVVDVEALPGLLERARPALVHLAAAAAHRALVQPAQAITAVCRPRGLPVLRDVAQALGQVPVHQIDADAVYGTGRQWLAGPRGVGFLAVRPDMPVLPHRVGCADRVASKDCRAAMSRAAASRRTCSAWADSCALVLLSVRPRICQCGS